jgi:hypothetical protein
MSHNPITTGRIGRVVYDLRHWKLTLAVAVFIMLPTLVFRFLLGRDFKGGGRTTDATFFHGARDIRRGWWANQAGAARTAIRLAVVAVLWLWFAAPALAIVVGCLALVAGVWRAVRYYQALMHEKRVLRPVWPAVAGIIGVPETAPCRRWLDIPRDMADNPDAEIVVGLRAADADDERRVAALVQLFDQRFGGPYMGAVDYARRLVHIRERPAEPAIWPAVAAILGVHPAEPAGYWCRVDLDSDNPTVWVRLPDTVINDEPLTANLKILVNQRFAGEWVSHANRQERYVLLSRKKPRPEPPTTVDYFADFHPDPDQQQGVN